MNRLAMCGFTLWVACLFVFSVVAGAESKSVTVASSLEQVEDIPDKAKAIIEQLGMAKIPNEGPWFIQTHKSQDQIGQALAERYATPRSAYTAIYLLLTGRDFSAMHRLATDEMWHFYGGNPAQLLLLYPDGSGEIKIWGSDIQAGQQPQILVQRGTWMGAKPIGGADAYSFGANTLSPGFEYDDYQHGDRWQLLVQYPAFAETIIALTQGPLDESPKKAVINAEKPQIEIEELVGRSAPQTTDKISAARFKMAAGSRVPTLYTKEGEEILFILSGEARVTIGDKVQMVKKDSVIYFPAKIPHSIDAITDLEFYVTAAPAWQPSDTVYIDEK